MITAACGTAGPAASWSAPIEGVVRVASGEPAAGAIVILTPTMGPPSEIAVADAHGRFVARVRTGEYAITATTPTGYVYRPAEAVSSRVELVLDPDCAPIRGTVPTTTAGIVRIGRFSDLRGDVFAARIGADHGFEACVPRSPNYYAFAEGDLVAVPVPVTVPQVRPLVLAAYDGTAVRAAPRGLTLPELSVAELLDSVPRSARIVGLGEATHGTHELQTLRLDLTIELVRRARIQHVLIEAGYAQTLPLNAYIQGEAVDPEPAVANLGYWIWDTEETLAALRTLRELNATRSPDTRIRLSGFDVQDDAEPAAIVAEHAAALELSPDQRSQIEQIAATKTAPPPEASRVLGAALLAAADRHAAVPDPIGSLAARALAHRLLTKSESGLPGTHERRDRGMADMVLALVEAHGAACAWAHNTHIGASPAAAMTSMGTVLRERLGANYYAIGYYVATGSVRAWDAQLSIGVIAQDLGAAPSYSLEAVVARATTSPVAYVPFARAPEPLMQWLNTPRYVREIAAVMRPDASVLRDLRSTYDAVIVVRDSHPTTATPTGVRVAKKQKI
jgi:erythromycin esterase